MNDSIVQNYRMEKIRKENLQVIEYYSNQGMSIIDSCKKVGITPTTFYNRRRKLLAYDREQMGKNKNLTDVLYENSEESDDRKRQQLKRLKKACEEAKNRKR